MRKETELRRVLANLETIIAKECNCPFPKKLVCVAIKQSQMLMADVLKFALGEESEIGKNVETLAHEAMRCHPERN